MSGTFCAAQLRPAALAHAEPWEIILSVTLVGLGIGLSFASMANLIVEAVPQAQTGEAAGMNTIMRHRGRSLRRYEVDGARAAPARRSNRGRHRREPGGGRRGPLERVGIHRGFVTGTVALALALGATMLIRGRAQAAVARRVEAPARG